MLRAHSWKFLRANEGMASIEFAILGSLLIVMLVFALDFSLALVNGMQVENAAQAGAQYAAVHGWDSAAITSAALSATPSPDITISPSNFCGCPSASGIATASCNSVCSDGSTAGTYVSVSATRNYATFLQYPGLPESFTLSSVSTVRIK